MRLRRLCVWMALAAVGLSATGGRADVRSIDIDQTPPAQTAGPFIIGVGKGFHIELTLDVLNASEITVGERTLKFSGKGGAVSGNGTVYLEGGKTYPIREKYTYTARIASIFITGEFSVSAESGWDYTAPESGNFTYSFAGSARDLLVTLGADVVGELRQAIVGNAITIGLTTIRAIPRNDTMVYSANFKATLQRTATLTFKEKSLPPWDIDRTGVIDIADVVRVALNFGNVGVGLAGDINLDGMVNIIDLVLVALHFNEQNVLAAPQFAKANARIQTVGKRESDHSYRLNLAAKTDAPVGGYAFDVFYDPSRWRLVETANRMEKSVSMPHSAPRGVARLVAVTLPLSSSRRADGALASFVFEPLTADANPSQIGVRNAQLSDSNGRLLRPQFDASRFATTLTTAQRIAVGQNFPNPFNPETWIPFTLTEESPVAVDILASDGRLVRRLELGKLPAGVYSGRENAAYWDGKDARGERVASGVYFYRLVTPTESPTRRMALVK